MSGLPPRFRPDRRARRLAAELLSGDRRVLARSLLRGARHERPVFVVGVPRSGTTSMIVLLRASPVLESPLGESHAVWLLGHHPRRHGWRSEEIRAGEVRRWERRLADAYFASHVRGRRLLDKTPANSLRIPHLLELWPDATIVVMRRNPPAVISSLMRGWRHPGAIYGTFVVPEDLRIPDYPHRRLWSFALPPDWRSAIGRPLAEVCTLQWERISGAIEAARAAAPATSRWVDVRLEDVVERPGETLDALCDAIGIEADPGMRRVLEEVRANPVNALAAPEDGPWDEALRPLLPRIASVARGRGYEVDPRTGDAALA